MRINTKVVYQMNDDGSFTELERESYEYDGPVAMAFGGDSSSSTHTETSQDIDTTTVGLQQESGLGLAAGGDIEFRGTFTDQGAIQVAQNIAERSFDFSGEFADEAFGFARDVATQSGQTSQQAVEVSRQAIGVVGTGGQSEITQQLFKSLPWVIAGIAAIMILPRMMGK